MEENSNITTKEQERYFKLVESMIRELKRESKRKTIMNYIFMSFIAFMFCGILWFFSFNEVEVTETTTTTYEQQADGDSSIVNGNQYKDNAIHSDASNGK